jgi:hypothetical protein
VLNFTSCSTLSCDLINVTLVSSLHIYASLRGTHVLSLRSHFPHYGFETVPPRPNLARPVLLKCAPVLSKTENACILGNIVLQCSILNVTCSPMLQLAIASSSYFPVLFPPRPTALLLVWLPRTQPHDWTPTSIVNVLVFWSALVSLELHQ